jgi:hypothetical protein
MSPDEPPLPVHPGLRIRFRRAGQRIAWTPVIAPAHSPNDRRTRTARLREDEARVEEWGSDLDGGLMVDSGPLGALVLLLAMDRRGAPGSLGATRAGRNPSFPAGSIVAVWGGATAPEDERPRLEDIVDLARYALE